MSDKLIEIKEDSTIAQADPVEVILAKMNILYNGFNSLHQAITEFAALDEFKSAEHMKKLLSEHSDETATKILYHLTCLNSINHGLTLLQSTTQSLLKVYTVSKVGD